MRDAKESEPWYRQFWPWFLIVLPASVVVAGLTTVVIAVRSSDSVVSDNYYREGLAINRVMAQDRRAGELSLRAEFAITGKRLALTLAGDLPVMPTALRLSFNHPLQADRDFAIPLTQVSSRSYEGELPEIISGRWYLELSDLKGEWRLEKAMQLDRDSLFSFAAGSGDD